MREKLSDVGVGSRAVFKSLCIQEILLVALTHWLLGTATSHKVKTDGACEIKFTIQQQPYELL